MSLVQKVGLSALLRLAMTGNPERVSAVVLVLALLTTATLADLPVTTLRRF